MTPWLRIVLLLIGAALLAAAAASALRTGRFVAAASASQGVVSRLNAGGAHPQIEFRVPDGSLVSYPQSGMIAGYRAGQKVRVFFNPANPAATARLDSFGSLWGDCAALAVCGISLLGLALSSFVLPIGFFVRGR